MSEIEQRLSEYCAFCTHIKQLRPKSIQSIQTGVQQFVEATQIRQVREVSFQSIEKWVMNGRIERNWSPKTVHIYLLVLSVFLDWCISKGLISDNPVKAFPRPKLAKVEPKALDSDQMRELMDWVRNFPFGYQFEKMRAIAIIGTFLGTGVRLSELRNLKLCDIDLKNLLLHVRCGKGAKDRTIPFRPSLARYLDDYLTERKRLNKTCPYFFTALRKDIQMGDLVIPRLVDRLRSRSGIYFSAHRLRHTYATMSLRAGMDIREVQELMGHTNIGTTAIYLAVDNARLREQVLRNGFDV